MSSLPASRQFKQLYEVYNYVAKSTDINISTLRKNSTYTDICQSFLKSSFSGQIKLDVVEFEGIKQENKLLKLEQVRLQNQILALTNALQKNSNALPTESKDLKETEAILRKLVEHFHKHVQVIEDEIVDPFASVRPVLIAKSPIIKKIFHN